MHPSKSSSNATSAMKPSLELEVASLPWTPMPFGICACVRVMSYVWLGMLIICVVPPFFPLLDFLMEKFSSVPFL